MGARYLLTTRAPLTQRWHKSYYPDLAAALALAWRRRGHGWMLGEITHGGEIALDAEGLARACDRMDELLDEAPRRPKRDAAEQVVRELGMSGDGAQGTGDVTSEEDDGASDSLPAGV